MALWDIVPASVACRALVACEALILTSKDLKKDHSDRLDASKTAGKTMQRGANIGLVSTNGVARESETRCSRLVSCMQPTTSTRHAE